MAKYRVTIKVIKNKLNKLGIDYLPDTPIEEFREGLKEKVEKGYLSSLEMVDILEEIKIYREDLKKILSNKKTPKKREKMKNFCKVCGKEIDVYAKLCRNCRKNELQIKKQEKEKLYKEAQKNGINIFVKIKPGKDILDHPKKIQGGIPGTGKKPGSRSR